MNLFLLAILGGVLAFGALVAAPAVAKAAKPLIFGMLPNYTPIVLAAQFGPLAAALANFRGQSLAVPPRLSAHYYVALNELRAADVKKLLETD